MSAIAVAVGKRIYAIRKSKKMKRDTLAELSGLHPTYIGQLERGEKNATLSTLESVSIALNVPVERFVEFISPDNSESENIPDLCYNLILEQTPRTQRRLALILDDLIRLYEQTPPSE